MTTSRIPVALGLVLATLGTFGVSCTAILAPRDDVQRCGTADDCDPTGDNRYVPACRFDEDNLDLDPSQVDKICVADFKPSVGCDEQSYINSNPEHVYSKAFDELGDITRYAACAPEQLGSLGCLPMGGACNQGLALNELGLCDDANEATPMAVQATTEELVGQDVRDQFCRSFFCDDRFVCNTSTRFCVVCDPDKPFGEGGCGEIYIAGARSCAYDDDECAGADVTDTDVRFGCGG
ncbi:hypothetical protein [Paraliomyxa miuraensis]|uniref:hypothetical protein n=1 Tax=Paraliomyxa miuraensis TaxID=376150 RepID=UPI002251299A|nr:hypothetical protein [Paraliomyxa miuraensis]MCX4242786.1 hypothetical protein [Paraliomyxa miuraensis]